jgi:hypothetical protein
MIEMSQDSGRLVGLLSGQAAATESLSESAWLRIVALAQKQRVAPLLHARLKECGVVPPAAAADRLRLMYLANFARNTRLFHELAEILGALRAAHIPVVLLKGVWLAEALYGDTARRQLGDIDLWIRRDRLDDARHVLLSLGYVCRSNSRRPQALQDALTGETQMFKPDTPMVELHWNIFAGEWLRHTSRIDEQVVWQRTAPLDNGPAKRLSAEDAVIHLCVHLAVNHQMSAAGLRTLVDLNLARRKWSIDWRTVGQRAHDWRVSCATWLVLQLLKEVFGDPDHQLPLAELAPSRLRQFVLRRFVTAGLIVEGPELTGGAKRRLFLLSLVDRPRDAAVLLWRAVFPDREWLVLRYQLQDAPLWRIWLQRLRHPWHLSLKRDA